MTGDTFAQQLARAWTSGSSLATDGVPRLSTLDQAEAVQDAALRSIGLKPHGWKLGASTHAARRALGLDTPFLAPLPEARTLLAPVRLSRARLRQCGVECELAVTLRPPSATQRALLAAPPSTHSLALAADLITACHSAIEIPESRFAAGLGAAGPLALVADNGAAGWVIVGPPGPADLISVAGAAALALDGEVVATGDVSAFVAPPLQLVQHFLHRAVQRGLLPDTPVSVLLGSVTPYRPLAGPVRVSARFDGLAPAELRLLP